VIRGTQGYPGTVAPFRAWRGSRDLVAQSPKFHAQAVAQILSTAKKSLAQLFGPGHTPQMSRKNFKPGKNKPATLFSSEKSRGLYAKICFRQKITSITKPLAWQ
jgi:hypothetical protein